MNKDAVILLSGGLDSTVSLAKAKEKYDIKLALFFNYGQKSFEKEKLSAQQIAEYYGIKLKVIELNWLKEITNTSLVNNSSNIPKLDKDDLGDLDKTISSMKNVWVPNRNALFINIAAAFCDSFGYDTIIIGANKAEAVTFPDNSENFISAINKTLIYSAQNKPQVVAPLINMEKEAIIKLGYELNVPFEKIRSCNESSEKHCGKCESCLRLKRGLERLGLSDILKLLFE